MYGYSIVLTSISLLTLINGQELDVPIRSSKSAFDAQFSRGRCPDRFYQIGNECLYFGTNGRKYSWHQVERLCATYIARLLKRQPAYVNGHVNVKPKKVARQIILNTPEKGKILEALYREYDELNFPVRLPSDYNKLNRCHDDKDDNWPQYCYTPDSSNATCFETNGIGSNDICLRQINCDIPESRLACEFTLPGSSELTASTFRHCPREQSLHNQLSIWAWLLIAVGGMLLLLLILGGVLTLIRSSKKVSTQIRKSVQVPIRNNEQVNPAVEPMLVRSEPDYLEPTPLKPVNPSANTNVRKDSTSPRV